MVRCSIQNINRIYSSHGCDLIRLQMKVTQMKRKKALGNLDSLFRKRVCVKGSKQYIQQLKAKNIKTRESKYQLPSSWNNHFRTRQ